MSKSVAAFLKQYAIESGEMEDDQSFVGADEITIVTDETQTELEESIAETAEVVDKLQDQDAAAEKVCEAADSLESNLAQIRALAAAGTPLNRTAMQFYIQNCAMSLEARGLPEAIFDREVGAMQHSFESNDLADYTTEAEEKTEGLLTKLVNMLKSAVAAAANWIKEFFSTIGKSADALKAGGQQLVRVGGTLKGEAKSATLKTSGYTHLDMGNVAKSLYDINGGYTTKITKISKALTAALAPLVAAIAAPTAAAVNAVEKSGANVTATNFPLPGGYHGDFKVGTGEGFDKLAGCKFTVERTPGAATSEEHKAETAPLTGEQVKAVGEALISLAGMVGSARDASEAATGATNSLLNAADKIVKKAGGKSDAEKADTAAARKLLTQAIKIVSAQKSIVPAYVKYMLMAGKEAYNFARASVANHGVSGSVREKAAAAKGKVSGVFKKKDGEAAKPAEAAAKDDKAAE